MLFPRGSTGSRQGDGDEIDRNDGNPRSTSSESGLGMKTIRRLALILFSGIFLIALTLGLAAFLSDGVAWRMSVLKLKLTGRIPEIPFGTLVKWLKPGSPVYLEGLAEARNVNAGVTNRLHDRQSIDAGARDFGRLCGGCHGENAGGRTGPSLTATLGTASDWAFFSTVKWGRPNTVMTAQPLSDLEIWQVYAYLGQLALEAHGVKKSEDSGLPPFQPVSSRALLEADRSGNWLTYAGNYAGYRHGLHNQISRRNVQQLRLAWAAQLGLDKSPLEATPIIAGWRMFVTESPDGVTALDIRNGATLWEFHRPVPFAEIPLCCGPQNRGVAILNDTVYVETLDAHLIALDASTGAKRWDVLIADWHQGYSMTGAPLAIGDRVVTGVAGGDFGIRGFLAAYSASDGALLWKFNTVPAPGEPGNETWGNESWKHGGVSTWATGSYDPALGLIFWGTSNPDPVYNPGARPGINLYANSVVALDARTGKLRWYYQFTPSDSHDWDATQQPILADMEWKGRTRPVLLEANRNGFFYVLDRQTGEFLRATPFAKQSWASGFTADGRPIVRPESKPSRLGSIVWPQANGATNWWSPSFDPQRHLLFVPSVDAASIFFESADKPRYRPNETYAGSTYERAPNQPITLAIRAIDVRTGDLRWDSTLAIGGTELHGTLGGLLSTEGDLVFGAYGTEFFALDADTGKKIWATRLNGMIHMAPVTYKLNGQQYIAMIAGRTLFTFTLPVPNDTVDAFAVKARPKPARH